MWAAHTQANATAIVAAKVDLRKNELTVSYAENVDDEIIISRIERAGYTVIK